MSTPFEASVDRDALAPPGNPTNPPQRILLVEDDADLRELSSRVLIRSSYQVDTAEDGEAGWKALQAVSYDLLITDNNMPKMSGLTLIKNVRSARMALPVIIASGTTPRGMEQLLSATILPKPFSPDQLVQAVKEVLSTVNRDLE
jgi:DNA-binding response OmpR family regulator